MTNPHNVVVLSDGSFLIADTGNHSVRYVDTQGVIQTFAGTGVAGFSGDGGSATVAQLNNPKAVGLNSAGAVLVADEQNDRIRVVGTRVAPASVSLPSISGLVQEGATLIGAAGG